MKDVDFEQARNIVELGVGNGCVTREILRRMRPEARLLSLEINPVFVEAGRRLEDERLTVVQACAAELPVILQEEGIDGVDAVVSSLPLSIMDRQVVDRVMEGSRMSLRPGGRFVQYQYSLRDHERLSRTFGDVAVGFTVLNIPPAFVYTCSASDAGQATDRKAPPSLGSLYAAALAAVAFAVRSLQNL